MAQKNPYFKFYASDWLGSTKRAMMTPAQRGAYIDLLAHQWNDETCSLPDDDDLLAALSGLGEGWLKVGSTVLRKCFPAHPTLEGRLANPRLLEIRFERDKFIAQSAAAGRKSQQVQAVRRIKVGSTTLATEREPPLQQDGQPNVNQPKPKPKSTTTPTVCSSSKRKRKTRSEAFEAWWLAYPQSRRTGKEEACKQWVAAVKRIQDQRGELPDVAKAWLLERTQAYAASPVVTNDRAIFAAVKWLKEGHYDDDPQAWEVFQLKNEGGDRDQTENPSRVRSGKADTVDRRFRSDERAGS